MSFFGKFLANGALFGGRILSKSFLRAMEKGAAPGAPAAAVTNGMPLSQALEILNLTPSDFSQAKVVENFNKIYKANDPDTGGSLYLQAKIWHARERVNQAIKNNEPLQ